MFPFLIAASKSLQRACLRIIFELYDLLFLSRCASCNEMGERPFCHLCQDALLHAPLPLHATNFIGSLWLYGGPLAQAFIQAKFAGDGMAMHALCTWAISKGCKEPLIQALMTYDFEVISWIPAHPIRRCRRGLQTPQRFASLLALELNLPVQRFLQCVRNDSPFSAGTSKQEREQRIKGRFSLIKNCANKRILLIDDIRTTGATLQEAQKVLETHGAHVWTFTLAQTP